MLKKVKIRGKILILLISIAILTLGIMGAVSYSIGVGTLEAEAFNKLTAVREMKASQIEDYFSFIRSQIVTFSQDRMIVEAAIEFDETHHAIMQELDLPQSDISTYEVELRQYYAEEFLYRLSANSRRDLSIEQYWPLEADSRLLQSLYISSNPNPTGQKDLLDNPGDGSSYSAAHERYHPIIRDYLEEFGYYDIFLVDANSGGHIIYSVFKEVDFGTSLLSGPYSETNFGIVYQAALNSDDKDYVLMVDFKPYQPSYNAPAAFIASPIFNGDKKVGVLIFQMPIDRINDIMTNNNDWESVGLGKSGETYIVGEDFLLRNQSRFLIEDRENYFQLLEDIGVSDQIISRIGNLNSTIGLQEVRTTGTTAALQGETGSDIFPDYRGVPVFSAYKPLNIEDVKWVIMSEKDEAEVFLPIQELVTTMLLGVAGIFIVIVVLSLIFSRNLTRPLIRLGETASKIADGDLDVDCKIKSEDEIGDLAGNVEHMRKELKRSINDLEDINQNLEQMVAERTSELELSERKSTSIIESAGEGIIVIDQHGNTILWNQAAEKMFGYTTEEIIGKPISQIVPEDYFSRHDTAMNKATVRGKLANPGVIHEVAGLRKNGTEFPMELTVSRWEISGATYYSGILRDITERKEAREALQQSRELLKVANERMSEELNFAKEIQMSLLPLIFPAFPTRSEFNIFAYLIPAREVGGDFYDFYFLDEDHLCFVIGDVSGKGAPGALLMAVSKTLIKSRAMDDTQPSSILTHVNNELSQNNESAMFVTVFLGVLNINSGLITYCNAGHNPPFIFREDGTIEKLDDFHGPVIGALPNLTYKESSTTLKTDEMIVLHTDGVTEAMNNEEEPYSDKRYEDFLESEKISTPQKLVDQVVRDVKKYEDGADQADDITMLAMQYHGASDVKETGRLELKIVNMLSVLEQVEAQFETFCRKHRIPDGARQKVSIVLDELLNNVINYAFPDEEEHIIRVHFVLTGVRLTITIHDDGIPFNPFELDPPDLSLSLDERSVGGLGIFMVRNMMDEYLYSRHIGKNVVRLVKLTDKE